MTGIVVTWITLGGCSLTNLSGLTGGNGDAGDEGVALYSIGGTVSGLEGTAITLVENATDSLVVMQDGAFKFARKLPAGTGYVVDLLQAADGHSCTVEHNVGRVTSADVTDIAVVCASSKARLSGLTLSLGALSPAFAPETMAYTAPLFVPDVFAPNVPVTITATTTLAGATLTVNGAVYVFRKSGTTWKQEAYVKASTTRESMEFGHSLALSSTGDTLAVGAKAESSKATVIDGDEGDASAPDAGAVYVFRRVGVMWKQQAYVKPSNTKASMRFGSSVALSSDGNTLAVGATGESSASKVVNAGEGDTSAPGSGAAYIFRRSILEWTQEAYIKATNTGGGNRLGASLALSADGNTLAVSAPAEASAATGINGDQNDTTAPGAGAVYVFLHAGSTWTQDAYIKASNARASTEFGGAIGLSSDGKTLAAGARGETSGATGIDGNESDISTRGAGAAYVFARPAGSWMQQAYVKPSKAAVDSHFGVSIGLSSDGKRLAVGAKDEAGSATGINGDQNIQTLPGAGAVYTYSLGATWTQQAYVKPSNTRSHSTFSISLAVSADGTALAVGSPAETSGSKGVNGNQGSAPDGTNSGAAYLFR